MSVVRSLKRNSKAYYLISLILILCRLLQLTDIIKIQIIYFLPQQPSLLPMYSVLQEFFLPEK